MTEHQPPHQLRSKLQNTMGDESNPSPQLQDDHQLDHNNAHTKTITTKTKETIVESLKTTSNINKGNTNNRLKTAMDSTDFNSKVEVEQSITTKEIIVTEAIKIIETNHNNNELTHNNVINTINTDGKKIIAKTALSATFEARRAAIATRLAKEEKVHQTPPHTPGPSLSSSSSQPKKSKIKISAAESSNNSSLNSSGALSSSSGSTGQPIDSPLKRHKRRGKKRKLETRAPPAPFSFPTQPSIHFERTKPDSSNNSNSSSSNMLDSSNGSITTGSNVLRASDPIHDPYARSNSDGYKNHFVGEKPLSHSEESESDSTQSDGLDAEFFEEDAFYSEYQGLDNWNARFQEAKAIIEHFDANTHITDRIGVNVNLIHLYQDFLYCVRTYSKIIISELYLPSDQKTIKPTEGIGGVAGGLKYRVNNILFKFAINHENLYADDDAAAKVAEDSESSVTELENCFVANRLAMSVLPISKDTICYGTDDAGRTIYNKEEKLSELMLKSAVKLNLAGHMVSDMQRHSSVFLHSAADVEGHKGYDNLFYLIDFSRTFPPEHPRIELLRPEFVHGYPKPLCSDAFSKFISSNEQRGYNNDIREATAYLLNTTVPQVAAELDVQLAQLLSANAAHHFRLIETVHSNGVNIRYLGLIRNHSNSSKLKDFILIEILARLLKTLMRLHLRETMKKLKVPLEQPYRRLLVDYLNLTFGECEKSEQYWNVKIKKKLMVKFESALSDEESAHDYKLKKALNEIIFLGKNGKRLLFEKVSSMLGLKFAPTVQTQLDTANFFATDSPLDYVDLEELTEAVKHTNVMAHSQGYLLKMKGVMKNRAGDLVSAKRFFQMAIDKCEESLNSNPNHKLTLRNCAQLLTFVEGALHQDASGDPESSRVQRANTYYLRAIKTDNTDAHSVFQYARFLNYCRRWEAAEDAYLRTMELDPHFERAWSEYTEFLKKKQQSESTQHSSPTAMTIVSANQEITEYIEGFKSRHLRLSKQSLLSSSDNQSEKFNRERKEEKDRSA